jgi:hypothetical protein
MLDTTRYQLVRNLCGAVPAAIIASSLFTVFGYSGVATLRDFANELALSAISFGSAAVFVCYIVSRERFLLNVTLVSLFGCLMTFVLKLLLLEGSNGLPAYMEQAAQQHSWKPLIDLLTESLMFTAMLTMISLPFIALGAWICTFVAKRTSNQTP